MPAEVKLSEYARLFDHTNPNFKEDDDWNRMFVHGVEAHANHVLVSAGHVLLNDVYDMLGFERSQAGLTQGWVFDNTRTTISIMMIATADGLVLEFNPMGDISEAYA